MTLNVYEGMFILDSNRYARDPAKVSGGVSELVEQQGGEMLVSRLWNEQKLAYPVKGHRKGTYWLTYFRMDSTRLSDLNHPCKLNGDILRSLVLKIDPRLVDAMVEHTAGDTIPAPAGESGSPDKRDAEAKGDDDAKAGQKAAAGQPDDKVKV